MACTQPRSGADAQHFYVLETDCGVTPTNPNFTPLRFTSGNPQLTRDALVSEELDGTREISSVRLGSKQTGGEIQAELSLTSYDDLLEAVLGGTWSGGGTEAGLTVTVAASGKTFTRSAGDYTVNVGVGDLVQFPGLTGNNAGVFRVTAVTALVITCAGIPDGTLSDESSVSTDMEHSEVLTVGTTRRTMTILSNYPDSSGAANYHIVTGVEVTGYTIEVATNALVTLTLPTIGRDYEAGAALPAGSTFNAKATTEPFSTPDGRLSKDGATLGFVTSLTMTHDTAASAQFALGDEGVAFAEKGRANSTLSVSTFFSNNDLLSAFLNETEVRLAMLLTTSEGGMSFDFPTVKFTSGTPEVGGQTAITQTLEAQATGDATTRSVYIRRLIS